MRATVFTGNQPRHLGLVESLAKVCDSVYVIQECNTVFPGSVKDVFDSTDIMERYFSKMRAAEADVFGKVRFLEEINIHTMALKRGDLNRITPDMMSSALDSDVYIVFGSSYIREEWLIDYLINHKAINIHMGVSPYYRGAACNFWAMYDGHPDMVGATIHLLGKGLDSGEILYHALPKPDRYDPFLLGMYAVKVAHDSLVSKISDGTLFSSAHVKQNRELQIRYSKNKDFTEEVANEYLSRKRTSGEIFSALTKRDNNQFIDAYIG